MPSIPSIQVYDGSNQPYNYLYDNIPIQTANTCLEILSDAIDTQEAILENSQGTAGDLASRLAVSLNPDGTIITQAVNNSLHGIDAHVDENGYVRMELSERTLLSTISPYANAISFAVDTISTTVPFNSGLVSITSSDSIQWIYTGGRLSPTVIYEPLGHMYSIQPVTSDNQNFTTTNGATEYISGSLRIYINGVRIQESPTNTFVPSDVDTSLIWVGRSYTEDDSSLGTFSLNSAIGDSDNIIIDFDFALV